MARIIKAAKGDVEPSRAQVSRRVEEAEHRAESIVLSAGDEGYNQGLAEAHDLVRRVEEVEQQLMEQTDRRIRTAQSLVEDILRAQVSSPEDS